jgi:hypothetical protein
MTMKPVSRGESGSPDFVLSNGACVEVKAGVDINGKPVIKSLEIYFSRGMRQIPEGGISQKILNEIDLNLAITAEIKSESGLADKRVIADLERFVTDGFNRAGRTPVDEDAYTALSFLYLEACKTNPGNPNAHLASRFGIERGTMIARLAKAKRLGILDYQAGEKPSGRAGAQLSDHGEKLIKELMGRRK